MKKTRPIAILLAAAIIVSSFGVVSAVDPQGTAGAYGDVNASHWAFKSIVDMSEKNVIAGYGDGTFKPAQTLTYGEFIKMMIVASTGQELQLAEKPNHWAYNYYRNGLERKLYSENDISKSMLDRDIPRKYMALIISNAMGDKEVIDYSQIEGTVEDVDSTVKYDYHIIKAYAEGILSGYADGSFKPDGTLTRAEATVVLQRFMEPEKRTPVSAVTAIEPMKTKLNEIKTGNDYWEVLDKSVIDEAFHDAKAIYGDYKIVSDASPLQMEYRDVTNQYGHGTWIDVPSHIVEELLGYGDMVLITDRKVSSIYKGYAPAIGGGNDRIEFKGNITTVDYIAFVPLDGGTVVLIVNPFK